MGNRPAIFTEADIRRAVKGVTSAGLLVSCVTIDQNGHISIQVGGAEPDKTARQNSWDEILDDDCEEGK